MPKRKSDGDPDFSEPQPFSDPVEAEADPVPVDAADPQPYDPWIVEPAKPDPDAVLHLGDGAKPTGLLRMGVTGSTAHLQYEWAADGKAVWLDVPHVVVETPVVAPVPPAMPTPAPPVNPAA